MNPQAETKTIDYSALTTEVTSADIQAFDQKYAQNTQRLPYIGFVVTVVFLVLLGLVVVSSAMGENGLALSVLFPLLPVIVVGVIIAVAAIFGSLRRKKYLVRLSKFADKNGAMFRYNIRGVHHAGMIFDEGHSREIREVLEFPGRCEIGNYTYVTGSGKNRSVHYWSYTKVKLPRKLPHMVLDAKKNNFLKKFSNLTDTFDSSQTLSLEGDFNEHFTLYAPKQYERDALYVFTPDVMAKLIDNGSGYDMEVIDDELYIYKGGQIGLGNETELRTMLSIVDAISDDLKDQTDYYADERVGDRAQNIIAAPGARLKHGVNWVVVGFVILMILFYTFDIWGRFLFWR